MKTNHLQIRLLAFVFVASMAGFQLRADDGIAGQAMEAQRTPHMHRTIEHQTGIRAPEGTLIHPVVHEPVATDAPIRKIPSQEDYHTQQMY